MSARPRDRWVLAGLLVLGVVLPAVISLAGGVLALPHNDDFAYRRAADSLYETGSIRLTGWSVMTLVGQLPVALPFLWLLGGDPAAFALTGLALAALAVAAGYALARRLLGPWAAAVAVLLLIVTPGFLRNAASFMTDIPALAAELSCLALGAAAIQRSPATGRWRWLAAALAVGTWAFSIREFAIAAPAAVLAAAFAGDAARRWRPYLLAGLALAAVCGAIYLFARSLPGWTAPVFETGPAVTNRVVDGIATLAFLLAPTLAVFVARWLREWLRLGPLSAIRARPAGVACGLAGLAVATLFWADNASTLADGPIVGVRLLIGTVFGRPGEPDAQVLAGGRPPLFPDDIWRDLNGLALVAGFVLLAVVGAGMGVRWRRILGALDPRRRPTDLGGVPGLLLLFIVGYATLTAVFGAVSTMFDRYLWPLVIPCAALLLWDRPASEPTPARADDALRRSDASLRGLVRPGPVVAGLALTLLAALSGALLLNAVAFDAARWRIGEAELARGLPATSIDAGFEWLGEHATGDTARVHLPFPANATRYSRLWASYRQCVVVSSSKLSWPNLELAEARQRAYRSLLVRGAWLPLYIYHSTAADCQPAP